MTKVDPNSELQEAILVLESKQKEELKQLKKEFEDVTERMRPQNIVKSGISQLRYSPKIRSTLITAGAGLLTFFLIRKISSGKKRRINSTKHTFSNPGAHQVKKAAGSLVKYIIAALISQNSDKIRDVAVGLINRIKVTSKTKSTTSSQHVS
jgi:hypothetical protein